MPNLYILYIQIFQNLIINLLSKFLIFNIIRNCKKNGFLSLNV